MNLHQEKNFKDWIKFLNPDEIRFNLISASIYITAYDNLINVIIGKIEDFYMEGFDENGYIMGNEYKVEVKGLYKRDIVIASLLWLEKNHAITME